MIKEYIMMSKTLEVNPTQKIALLGILGALGIVLYVATPIRYPIFPDLQFEFSDIVVLIAFLLFGFREAAFLAAIKAVMHLMVYGPAGPIAIGQISAFIASMVYILGIYLAIKIRIYNKPYFTIPFVVVLIITTMTISNFFIVTPIYFNMSFLEAMSNVNPGFLGFNIGGGYIVFTLILYVPFNFVKALVIMLVFYVIKNPINRFIEGV